MEKTRDKAKQKKIISLTVFIVGMIMLVVGIVFLVLNLTRGTAVADGEYLTSVENWQLEDSDRVIWDFTEIGKGTLTTNTHTNDYDFIWAIEDGKLKIETNWLYELENEYDYSLDQNAGILTLTSGDNTYKFIAQ